MDERLAQALEYSKYMISLNNQKKIILEQYKESLDYYFNGGKFTITSELLSLCKLLLDFDQSTTVLIDADGVPIEILDLKDFFNNVISEYVKANNRYLFEYQKLAKQRSIQGIINL
jgi:hypothetical protein